MNPANSVMLTTAAARAPALGPSFNLWASLSRLAERVKERSAYALAALPVFTDFIDTGHLPEHPRELVTEVVIGSIILVGVALLYRKVDRLQTLAETDALTGLGNRLRFRADLERAAIASRTQATPVAIALIDIDQFKGINDRWGHDLGDEVLKAVAMALARSVRQGFDGAYRLGGDEFALIINNTDGSRTIEAVQRQFEGTVVGAHVPVSFSMGVFSAVALHDPGAMLREADRLMYAAKNGAPASAEQHFFSGTVTNRPTRHTPAQPTASTQR